MNEPRKPADPPAQGAPSDADPAGKSPNGIPDEMDEHEPKGTPNSDRHGTETAPST